MIGSKTRTVNALIAQAAEWRLLGLLLERPRPGWHEEVAALGREVRHADLRGAAAAAAAATEGEYLALLGPAGVSPREVSYQTFADPGALLAQLAAMYEAFAFQPRAEDPADHLAVEAGFVGYLFLKEAFARSRGERVAAATTATARQRMLAEHLTAARPLAQRLAAAGESYLAAASAILAEQVPEHRAVGVSVDSGDGFACGACIDSIG